MAAVTSTPLFVALARLTLGKLMMGQMGIPVIMTAVGCVQLKTFLARFSTGQDGGVSNN